MRGGWGIILVSLALLSVLVVSVALLRDKEEEEAPESLSLLAEITLSFERLPPRARGHYELWERRPSGGEQRLGTFRVLEGGSLVTLTGDPLITLPLAELPPSGTEILLTIEAGDTPSERRSERVLLHGTLGTTEADLTPRFPKIPKGQVALLATPTKEGAPGSAGVWFAKKGDKKGSPSPGLSIPRLPEGWVYGGWVVTGAGTTLPTGLFPDPWKADEHTFYGGSEPGWDLPGEDFLRDAPEGVKFPPNLADGRTQLLVSMEPDFDGAEEHGEPFLPLLTTRIPYKQAVNTPFPLGPVEERTFPQGRLVIAPRSVTP